MKTKSRYLQNGLKTCSNLSLRLISGLLATFKYPQANNNNTNKKTPRKNKTKGTNHNKKNRRRETRPKQ